VVRFTEGKPGVFTLYDGPLQARIIISVPSPGHLTYSWWWSRDDTELSEQFRAEVRGTG
jgi:hypothetical protein